MIALNDIAQFLDHFFAVHLYKDDQNGIYILSTRPIKRLGLALEPWTGLRQWVNAEKLDAIFLHRPWQLQPEQLAADIGVLAYHLAFDENLTLGFNARLATVLGMSTLEVLGKKQGRSLGMIGNIPSQDFASYCVCVEEIFGGYDQAIIADHNRQISRVAVVGAMNDALVREAAARGADVYITGQLRQPAQAAVEETGIGVVAVGHRRSEEWGLRALAGLLRDRWSRLEVILPSHLSNSEQSEKSVLRLSHHRRD